MHDAKFNVGIGVPGLTLFASVIEDGVIDSSFRNVATTFFEQVPGFYQFTGTNIPDTGTLFIHTGDITGSFVIYASTNDLFEEDSETELLAAFAAQFGAGPWGAGVVLTAADIWTYFSRTLTAGAGAGMFLVTVTITDGTNPVSGAVVLFQEVGNAANTRSASSDIDGHVFFLCDPADYYVAIVKFGLSFVTVTQTVIDATPLSFAMTLNTAIVPPTNPALCTLYGDFFLLDGTPAANVPVLLSLISTGLPVAGGVIVRTGFPPIMTDGAGHFEQDVVRTDLITPIGSVYEILCNAARMERQFAAATSTLNVTA